MSAVELFSSGEFNLQVLPDDNGGFQVLAPGLARALAVTDSYTLLRSIPDDEKGSALVRTPGGEQRVSYVTEAGFYRAIGQRQTGRITDPTIRDTVERFQSWVYNDVLPRIRRTGAYAVPAQRAELSNRDLALMVIAEADRADAAEARAAELAPKAAAADALTNADGALSIGAVANMFGIGRTTLFRILYAEGVLIEIAAWKPLPSGMGRKRRSLPSKVGSHAQRVECKHGFEGGEAGVQVPLLPL